MSRHASARRGAPCEAWGSTENCESTRRPTRGVPIARVGEEAEPRRSTKEGPPRRSCCTNPTPAARLCRNRFSRARRRAGPIPPVTRRDPIGANSRVNAADRRFAAAGRGARLNQLAGGLALCLLPSKNGNRGGLDGRGCAWARARCRRRIFGTTVESLEKAGAGIKLVTVATQCSIRRQRRRAAATIGVVLRLRG